MSHAPASDDRSASALNAFGRAAQTEGRRDEAIAAHRAAIRANPGDAQSYRDLVRALGVPVPAPDAWSEIGTRLQAARLYAEALGAYRFLGTAAGADVRIENNVGVCLIELQQWDAAEALYRGLLDAHPGFARGWTNLGLVLTRTHRHADAEAALRQAIALDSRLVHAHANLGHTLAAVGRHDEALTFYGEAARLAPGHARIRTNHAIALLRAGELERGWPDYEWRLQLREPTERDRLAARTRWHAGMPLANQTIFVHAEQGLGDTLQFTRYLPLLAAQGAQVILEVQPPLISLLAGFPGVQRIIAQGEPLPAFDFYCPLLSLPFEFGTRLDSIPEPVAFRARTDKVAAWADRVGSQHGGPRVGVAWSGRPTHDHDHLRSIPLRAFRRLFDALPAVPFFSLQKDPGSADAALLATISNLANLGPRLDDFGDTAAAIAHLDLVITVDTSVAHLAGTMGKPVWVLLPMASDWRWLLGCAGSPWYPTAMLYRQRRFGDWEPPLGEIIGRLTDGAPA